MTDNDRTVFALLSDGGEIVRYDRAGKWWVEYPKGQSINARMVYIKEAAYLAAEQGRAIYLNLPGGKTFYHLLKGIQNRERMNRKLDEEAKR